MKSKESDGVDYGDVNPVEEEVEFDDRGNRTVVRSEEDGYLMWLAFFGEL